MPITAYYNGACPVCSREMRHYGGLENGPALCDVAADPEALARHGVSARDAKRRLHVIDEDGRLIVGFDAMLRVWAEMPAYHWAALLFGRSGVRPVAAFLYEHVVAAALYSWAERRLHAAGRPR